jgi:hypothetical protein
MDASSSDSKPIQPKPIVIPTREILAGFPAADAPAGSYLWIEVSGYHTFDEGLKFYTQLEVFNRYVRAAGLTESRVGRILVCICQTETLIYADSQLPIMAKVRAKRAISAKETVYVDDIAGVNGIDFPGVSPPPACGFLLLLSVGWRRGMCFDLRALPPNGQETSEETFARLKQMGGMVLAHLYFTERFLLSNSDWGKVLRAGWFPFVFLSRELWCELFAAIRNGWDLQPIEEKVHEAWTKSCDARLDIWNTSKYFSGHVDFMKRSIRAYKEGDWLTVVSVAAPRVEGLLRGAFGAWGKQREVINKLTEGVKKQEHTRSLLFPDRLKQYFDRVFFRFTEFKAGDLPSNRHTLAHGLVGSDKLTRREALTLLLLIDHVLYCMPSDEPKETPPHA